jgi:phage shock protein PspC (stress-responsive transcriptional regulator)
MQTRLYRSTTDRILGGVCGGIATYLAIDPVLVRLFFVLLTIGGGSGILVYLILWVILPEAPGGLVESEAGTAMNAERPSGADVDTRATIHLQHPHTRPMVGIGLLLLGLVFLIRSLQPLWFGWINPELFWPLLLIAGGAVLIMRRNQEVTS